MNADLPVLFTGFSQGVATAFRGACASGRRVAGVVAVGGDIPPELSAEALARLPAVLLARGERDDIYTLQKWNADQARLRAAGVPHRAVGFDGGHEWHDQVNREAGAMLGTSGIGD